MTVSTTTSRVEYAGNGSTTAFAVPFYFLANGDLKVYQAGTLKTITTHYTVSGAGNPAGGTVTFVAAPANGDDVAIFRDPAITQETDYIANDPFPAESHERALDRLTMIAQRNRDLLGRTFRLADGQVLDVDTELPEPEAFAVVGWNSSGTALQNYQASDFATALTYADRRVETFTGDGSTVDFVLAETPAVVANTDVDIEGVSQVPGVDYTLLADGLTLRFDTAPANGLTIAVKYGQAVAQSRDDAATVYFAPAGSGAVSRSVQSKLRDVVSAKDFGAVGDGVVDDSTALQAAINHAKTNGSRLFVPAGRYKCKNLRLESGTQPWALFGEGTELTIFEHVDGNGTLMIGNDGSSVPYELCDFTVDCQFAETANVNANNAISFADTSGVVIRRVKVQNYKNNGILGFATVANTFGDCVGEDCEAIGNGATTNNGLIFAEMPRCKWINCKAVGVRGAPGYGVQLKNDCRFGEVVSGYAADCKAGLAFGTDAVSFGAQNCVVSGFISIGCTVGAVLGEAKQCRVEGLVIDMESAVENGVDIQANSVGCSVSATVRNINAVRSAVRVRSDATDNTVSLVVDNVNTTGKAVTFDSGSRRNVVILERATNPTTFANGPRTWVTDNSINQDNSFDFVSYPFFDSVTISSGVVTLKNPLAKGLIIDTEASAATDDLDTITAPAIEFQTIVIRTNNDARDVVVKHTTGNINLNGAADLTLTTRRSFLVLCYSGTNSRWNEVSRSINP